MNMSFYLHNYPMKWAELGLLLIYESVKKIGGRVLQLSGTARP